MKHLFAHLAASQQRIIPLIINASFIQFQNKFYVHNILVPLECNVCSFLFVREAGFLVLSCQATKVNTITLH